MFFMHFMCAIYFFIYDTYLFFVTQFCVHAHLPPTVHDTTTQSVIYMTCLAPDTVFLFIALWYCDTIRTIQYLVHDTMSNSKNEKKIQNDIYKFTSVNNTNNYYICILKLFTIITYVFWNYLYFDVLSGTRRHDHVEQESRLFDARLGSPRLGVVTDARKDRATC